MSFESRLQRETYRTHQPPSFQRFFVAVEADPGAEDDGAHKVNVAHELDGRRNAGHDASVQIEGQRDGFHGDHHLGTCTLT